MSGSFVGREMPAANCDVSSESGRGRVGFLSPSPKGHTVAQVISQDPRDLSANGLSSFPVVPLSFFLHLHSFPSSHPIPSSPPVLSRPSPAVPAVSWVWLTSLLNRLSVGVFWLIIMCLFLLQSTSVKWTYFWMKHTLLTFISTSYVTIWAY